MFSCIINYTIGWELVLYLYLNNFEKSKTDFDYFRFLRAVLCGRYSTALRFVVIQNWGHYKNYLRNLSLILLHSANDRLKIFFYRDACTRANRLLKHVWYVYLCNIIKSCSYMTNCNSKQCFQFLLHSLKNNHKSFKGMVKAIYNSVVWQITHPTPNTETLPVTEFRCIRPAPDAEIANTTTTGH